MRDALEKVPGAYADRSYMWTFNETFKELAFDSPLGELCATFMGSDTCGLLSEIAFVKQPHTTDVTPWHHDQPYYQITTSRTTRPKAPICVAFGWD